MSFMTCQVVHNRAIAWPIPSEHDEQVALFGWAQLAARMHPGLELLYAIPNAAKRTGRQGKAMKAEGLRPGFPDVGFPVPAKRNDPLEKVYHGAFIEMKAKDAPKPRIEQQKWLDALSAQGYACTVAYGFEEAQQFILNYLAGKL